MLTPAFAVASPWLLLGGALLASIPILIHLLRRQRCKTQSWGAMQFVRRAARRRSRRTRLEALVLLVVRTLIILFIALALARPYIVVSGTGDSNEMPVQHLIVIDASASMAHNTGGKSRFEQAVADANQIVESARVGDAFNLLQIGGNGPVTVIHRPAYDRADVHNEINRLQCSHGRGRVLNALEAVLVLLSDRSEAVSSEVYLVSDLQANNWPMDSPEELDRTRGALREISEQARVTVIDIGEAEADNAAVIDLQGHVRIAGARLSTVVTATLCNYGTLNRPAQRVELWINGQISETLMVDLPPRVEQTVSFDVPVTSQSDAVAEVRLPRDQLVSDDSRWLILPPIHDYRILLVDGAATAGSSLADASGFLKLALQPDAPSEAASETDVRPAMLPIVISDGMLTDVRLDEYDCVYLCNVALLTEREVNLLEQFVIHGGGLVVVLGDAVRSANYNELLFQNERRLLPARLLGPTGDLEGEGRGFRFLVDDYSHPMLAPFEGNETAGLLSTRIDRFIQTVPDDDPATRIILRYSSGDAAILERDRGDGRVVLVTTALDDHWGNWALWPSFVPMMHELTRYASTGDFGCSQHLIGGQIVIPVPADETGREFVIVEAGGAPLRLTERAGDSGAEAISPPLQTPGPVELRIPGPKARTERYAVNVDAAESNLAKIDRESIESLFPPDGDTRYLNGWQPRSLGDTTTELTRSGLSRWFLIAAGCLLLVEQLMAWRFALGLAALGLVILAALVSQVTGSPLTAASVAGSGLLGSVAWLLLRTRRISSVRRESRPA